MRTLHKLYKILGKAHEDMLHETVEYSQSRGICSVIHDLEDRGKITPDEVIALMKHMTANKPTRILYPELLRYFHCQLETYWWDNNDKAKSDEMRRDFIDKMIKITKSEKIWSRII